MNIWISLEKLPKASEISNYWTGWKNPISKANEARGPDNITNEVLELQPIWTSRCDFHTVHHGT